MLAEISGFLAAGLVLATFCMRSMRALRLTALISNVVFLIYGLLLDLIPVIALHACLMPINIVRLRELAAQQDGLARTRPGAREPTADTSPASSSNASAHSSASRFSGARALRAPRSRKASSRSA